MPRKVRWLSWSLAQLPFRSDDPILRGPSDGDRDRHLVGRRDGVLVLPEPEDEPSELLEVVVGVAVASLVRRDLVDPPPPVRLRGGRVDRTSVPEAPVDEHCDLRTPEENVRPPSAQSGQWMVDPVPKSAAVQFSTQGQLRDGVTSLRPAHPFRHLGARSGRTMLPLATGPAVLRHPASSPFIAEPGMSHLRRTKVVVLQHRLGSSPGNRRSEGI